MSPNPSSPPRNNNSSSGGDHHQSSTVTGLTSPFSKLSPSPPSSSSSSKEAAAVTNNESGQPPSTPQVTSYRVTKISEARKRVKSSFVNSPLLNGTVANGSNNSISNSGRGGGNNNSSGGGRGGIGGIVEYIFPRFDKDELLLGKILGCGGFGLVLEVKGFQPLLDDSGNLLLNGVGAAGGDNVYSVGGVGKNGDEEHSKNKNNSNNSSSSPFRMKSRSFDIDEISDQTDRLRRKSPTRRKKLMRTRALSWTHHGRVLSSRGSGSNGNNRGIARDVSHFFHRKEKESNDGNKEEGGGKNDDDVSKEIASGDNNNEQKLLVESSNDNNNDDVIQESTVVGDETSKGGVDEGKMGGTATEATATTGDVSSPPPSPTKKRVRQISRNFSLQAWRDSDPGNEGDDAISEEEMAQYKSEYSIQSATVAARCGTGGGTEHSGFGGTEHSGASVDVNGQQQQQQEAAQESCNEVECLVNVVGDACARTTIGLSTVLERSEVHSQFDVYETGVSAPPAERDAAGSANDDATGEQQQQQQQTQRIRIVFFQPKDELRGIQQDKQYISENATTNTGESRYAIKIIQPDIVQNDFKKFLQAAMDMATETYFLSVLSHPNILKMRAVGQGDMFSPDYFLVLDRLYDTLLDKIEGSWKDQYEHLENSFFVWNRTRKMKMLWAERMGVMRDIAGALGYMHDLRIIYRDIKPENIGFDSKGVVKLFDFGLAKEVRKEDESPNGTYKLTAETGSLRYMAPEVGNKWPYNFLADSYSFGIMLWEVAALDRPFAMYTPNEIRDMVMKWGERPKVKDVWPDRVKELMTSAWDSSFRKRPTMDGFRDALDKEVAESLHNA